VGASPKPDAPHGTGQRTSLEALGTPNVTNACKGNDGGPLYRRITSREPVSVDVPGKGGSMTTKKYTSGFQVSRGTCATTFTWSVEHRYTLFAADLYLDMTGSVPQDIAFADGSSRVRFEANGRSVEQVQVLHTAHVRVPAGGESFSVIVLGRGDGAGNVDVIGDELAPRS
jgi:hypothetical protein